MDKTNLNQSHEPEILNKKGTISSPWILSESLHEVMMDIFRESSQLFPPTIISAQDVQKKQYEQDPQDHFRYIYQNKTFKNIQCEQDSHDHFRYLSVGPIYLDLCC